MKVEVEKDKLYLYHGTLKDFLIDYLDFHFESSFMHFGEVENYVDKLTEKYGETLVICVVKYKDCDDIDAARFEGDLYILHEGEWEKHMFVSSHSIVDCEEAIDDVNQADAW